MAATDREAELPVLKAAGDRAALFVDGKPFLILGLQWDCDSCFSPQVMNPLFAHASRIGCNSASLLLYWRLIEPQEGSYDFSLLDTMLEQARGGARPGAGSKHLRIVLVWFGAFKNGTLNYAPDYVKADTARFGRVRDQAGAALDNFACPNGTEIRRGDGAALLRVLAHLEKADRRRTVILLQLENEVGLSGTERCHCPACNGEFERGGWAERHGRRAAEA